MQANLIVELEYIIHFNYVDAVGDFTSKDEKYYYKGSLQGLYDRLISFVTNSPCCVEFSLEQKKRLIGYIPSNQITLEFLYNNLVMS